MTRIHLLLLVCINALWGFNFVAAKTGTAIFGPLLFISVRFAIVLSLLVFFIRWVPGQMPRIIGIGLCMGLGHYGFMFYAIYLAGSLSSVAIASQLTVPFATLLAIFVLGERIGLTRVLAIATSFAGVVLIGFEPVNPGHLTALGYTTIASAAMAWATILMRQLDKVAVFNLQAWVALCSMLSIGAIAWVVENPSIEFLQSIPIIDYWSALYSAVGATIAGHGTLYYLLQRYSVSSIAPFITLSTVFAIGFGIVFMNDTITVKIILGAMLTLLGVTVIAMRNARTKVPSGIRAPR